MRRRLGRTAEIEQQLGLAFARDEIAGLQFGQPRPGVQRALRIAGLVEQARQPPPGFRPRGLGLGDGQHLDRRAGLVAPRFQQLGQAVAGPCVGGVDLQHAPPDAGLALRIRSLDEGRCDALPAAQVFRLALRGRKLMARRLGRAAQVQQQPRHLVVGVGIGGIRGQHLAPGGQCGGGIAGLFQRLGGALPGLGLVRLQLGQGLQMRGRLGLEAPGVQQRRQALVRSQLPGRSGQELAPDTDLALAVAGALEALAQPPPGAQRLGAMGRQPAQVRPRAFRIAFRGRALRQPLVRGRVVGGHFQQALPGRPCSRGVAGLVQKLGQPPAGVRQVGAALGQHLEVGQGGGLAIAHQPGQGDMRLDVVVLKPQHPPPGVDGAGGLAHAGQGPGQAPPDLRLLGRGGGGGVPVRRGLGGIAGEQLGQGEMGFDLARGQLQHPAPGEDRLLVAAKLGQRPAEPPPGGAVAARVGQDAQVLQRAGLQPLGGEQLGQPVVGVGIGAIEVEHPAPDLEGLGALAQLFQGAGVALPGLDLGGIRLRRGSEMQGGFRAPALLGQ